MEGVCHPGDEGHCPLPLQGSGSGQFGEGTAPEVLEGDVQAVRGRIPAHVVHHHYVRVGQPGGGAGLGEEPLLEALGFLRGHRKGKLDGLERDLPAQLGMVRPVDHPHHAAAQLFFDHVARDLAAAGFHGSGS